MGQPLTIWPKTIKSACAIIALLLVQSIAAASQETFLVLNGLSYHSNTKAGLNEQNFGLGLAYRDGPCGTEGGFYRNSFSKPSFYGVAYCETDGRIRPGVWASLASNYPYANNPQGVTAFAGVQIAIGQFVIRATYGDGLVLFANIRIPLR